MCRREGSLAQFSTAYLQPLPLSPNPWRDGNILSIIPCTLSTIVPKRTWMKITVAVCFLSGATVRNFNAADILCMDIESSCAQSVYMVYTPQIWRKGLQGVRADRQAVNEDEEVSYNAISQPSRRSVRDLIAQAELIVAQR